MPSITKKRINNVRVEPIVVSEPSAETIKGYNCIPYKKCNIFLSARKMSGKTTVIFKILKEKAGKHTSIIVVSNTFYNDSTYQKMSEYFESKGIPFIGFTSLKMDGGGNLIDEFIKQKQNEQQEKLTGKEEVKEKQTTLRMVGGQLTKMEEKKEPKERKERKPKMQSPKYIFVFDDLAKELKTDRFLQQWITLHRHFDTINIISSQYWNHVQKDDRANIDIIILFKNVSKEKLKDIHEDTGMRITLEKFEQLYYDATEKDYNFLYIDPKANVFRHNFDVQYQIN